ncbi:TetR family transcriptional regulator, partial [Veillonellaceae bacterium M2-4]|nr:TetR family transcriptional regulator [Veillonellaceae bacterium M2-4]
SPYLAFIKLHLSKNEVMLTPDFKQKAIRLKNLDAKTWSAMVLSHETIKLVLFDPDHKNIYLERFKHSLELLDEEG